MRKNRFLLAIAALLSFIAIDSSFPVLACIAIANRPSDAKWRYGPEVRLLNRDEKQGPLCIRDVTNDKELGQFPRGAGPWYDWYFAVSPDNRTLASTTHCVRLWDLSSGTELPLDGEAYRQDCSSDYCHFLAFTSDGKTLVGTNDERIAFWDVTTGNNIVSFDRSWITVQIVLVWLLVTLLFYAIGGRIRLCLSRIRKHTPVRHPEPLRITGE
jgi:WD40 repeat protein